MFDNSMPGPIEEIVESLTGEAAGPFDAEEFADEQGPLDPEHNPWEHGAGGDERPAVEEADA